MGTACIDPIFGRPSSPGIGGATFAEGGVANVVVNFDGAPGPIIYTVRAVRDAF